MKKNNKELRTNKLPSTIVVICKTFSHHLFVTAHIHPHILERLRDTFLFWIKMSIISNTEIIICVIVNKVVIIYFLENNIEYTIFNKVKIATAIIKFTTPLMINFISGNISISFIVFDNNHKSNPLIQKLTIG